MPPTVTHRDDVDGCIRIDLIVAAPDVARFDRVADKAAAMLAGLSPRVTHLCHAGTTAITPAQIGAIMAKFRIYFEVMHSPPPSAQMIPPTAPPPSTHSQAAPFLWMRDVGIDASISAPLPVIARAESPPVVAPPQPIVAAVVQTDDMVVAAALKTIREAYDLGETNVPAPSMATPALAAKLRNYVYSLTGRKLSTQQLERVCAAIVDSVGSRSS
jgi:hypothetical protein